MLKYCISGLICKCAEHTQNFASIVLTPKRNGNLKNKRAYTCMFIYQFIFIWFMKRYTFVSNSDSLVAYLVAKNTLKWFVIIWIFKKTFSHKI